mgnify:CR=1 FL=1
MGFVIANAITMVKTFIVSGVTRAAILAMDGLIAFIFDETEGVSSTYVGDAKGDDRTSGRAIQPGRCYDFDGTDDHIVIAGEATWLGSFTTLTVALDVELDSVSNISIINGVNFSAWTSGSATRTHINGTARNTQTTALSTGVRYRMVFTWDGTTAKMYLNGVESSRSGSTSLSASSSNTYIGAYTDGSSSFALDACVRNVQYWKDYVFDSDDIAQDLATGSILDGDTSATIADCKLWLKAEESAGTTAFDSSGNSNDGVLTNITASTFHAADVLVTRSWANDVGYSDGGAGVIIPRDESDTANDVTGSALDYSGRVKYDFNLVESNCANFDGTDDYADIGGNVNFTGQFDFRWGFVCDSFAGTPSFFGGSEADNVIVNSGGTLRIRIDNTYYDISGITLSTGVEYSARIVRDGSDNVTFYVDDVEYNTAASASGTFTFRYIGSRNSTSQFMDGCMWDLHMQGEFVTTRKYPMSEGSGTVLYDIGTAADHATLTNITEANFWGESQDSYHYNINNGFTQVAYFDGVDDYISASVNLDSASSYSVTAYFASTGTSEGSIFGNRDGGVDGVQVRLNGSGTLTIQHNSSLASTVSTYNDGLVYRFVADWDGADISITVYNLAGTELESVSTAVATSLSISSDIFIARRGYLSFGFFAGLLSNLSVVKNGSTLLTFKLDDGVGTNIEDSSGNGNDGTATSITELDFWALKLPADSSGDDPLGLTASNSSGVYHNNSETKYAAPEAPALRVADDAKTTARLYSGANPVELGYSDFEDDFDDEGFYFSDVSTANEYKNLLIFDEEKTGSDLSDIQEFLNH